MPQLAIVEKDLSLSYDGTPGMGGGLVSSFKASLIPDNASAGFTNMDTVPREGEAATRKGTRRIYSGSNIGQTNKIVGIDQHDFGTATNLGRQTVVAMKAATATLQVYRRKESDDSWTAATGTWTASTGSETRVSFAELSGRLFMVNGVSNLFSFPINSVTFTDEGNAGNADLQPASRQIANHTNRICAVGPASEGNTLYFSQFNDGTVWDRALWSISIGRKYNPITGIVPWTNHDLVVLKERSSHVVNCNPETSVANFTVRTLHDNIGSVCPLTGQMVGDDVWFLTRQGIMIVERSGATDTHDEITILASEDVQDLFDRINWAAAPEIACAYFWNNRYLLGVPLDHDTENTWLVCNARTRKWMGSWGNIQQPRLFSRYDGVNPGRLRMGNSAGQVFELMDWVLETDELPAILQEKANPDATTADGTYVPAQIVSRAYNFKEPKAEKDLFDVTIEFNRGFGMANIAVKLDGGTAISIGNVNVGDPDVHLPVNLPFNLSQRKVVKRTLGLSHLPPCKECQIVITGDNSGTKLVVGSIEVSAFVASSHSTKVDNQ